MPADKISIHEITDWLTTEGKNGAWLAKTMGVTPATVSRWLNGKVTPSGSDESLLRMLVRGEMPFELIGTCHLHGVLDFTQDQWRVIETLARRSSLTPGKWIADQIRSYLSYNEAARQEMDHIITQRRKGIPPHIQPLPSAKVADAPKQSNGGN